MRHRVHYQSFGRKMGPRKALLRGLVDSVVEHGRIKTTLGKAKEVRRLVERAVTVGKEDTVHARRVLLSRYPNKGTVDKICSDIAPRMKDRPGGYTRVIKLGHRPNDAAEMAFLEFVDYELPEKKASEAASEDDDTDAMEGPYTELSPAQRAKKKRDRKLQKQSRRQSR